MVTLFKPNDKGKYQQLSPLSLPGKANSSFAWMIIILVLSFGFFGAILGAGNLVRFIFPAISLVTSIYLYFKHSLLFVGFTWWVWCLTPLIRRLCDFYGTPDPNGIILLTPYLVTFVCSISLVTNLPRINKIGGLPFVWALAAIMYAVVVGIVQNPLITVIRAFLDWIVPVLFSFYLFANWKDYPLFKENLQKVFLTLTFATGLYGVFQFVTAPQWDLQWLEMTRIVSMGDPEPFGLRVWSTLHSPSPFATLMASAILLLAVTKSKWAFPVSVIGYLSLLLTFVRSAWGGWLVGLFALIASLKPKPQIRLLGMFFTIMIVLLPLTMLSEDIRNPVVDRFESLTILDQDTSFNARIGHYERDLEIALTRVVGRGMGSSFIINPSTGKVEIIALDSGIFDSFFTLGWVGSVLYLSSIFVLLQKCFQRGGSSTSDPFAIAARSISLSIISQLALSSLMLGFSGMLMWSMIGICLAQRRYGFALCQSKLQESYNQFKLPRMF